MRQPLLRSITADMKQKRSTSFSGRFDRNLRFVNIRTLWFLKRIPRCNSSPNITKPMFKSNYQSEWQSWAWASFHFVLRASSLHLSIFYVLRRGTIELIIYCDCASVAYNGAPDRSERLTGSSIFPPIINSVLHNSYNSRDARESSNFYYLKGVWRPVSLLSEQICTLLVYLSAARTNEANRCPLSRDLQPQIVSLENAKYIPT